MLLLLLSLLISYYHISDIFKDFSSFAVVVERTKCHRERLFDKLTQFSLCATHFAGRIRAISLVRKGKELSVSLEWGLVFTSRELFLSFDYFNYEHVVTGVSSLDMLMKLYKVYPPHPPFPPCHATEEAMA